MDINAFTYGLSRFWPHTTLSSLEEEHALNKSNFLSLAFIHLLPYTNSLTLLSGCHWGHGSLSIHKNQWESFY